MYFLYMYFKNFFGEGYDLVFYYFGSNYFSFGVFKFYFFLCVLECEVIIDFSCFKIIGFYYSIKLIFWLRKKLVFY